MPPPVANEPPLSLGDVFLCPAQVKAQESADWHLDQGDRAADERKLKSALEHYQKALALEPKNLVAQEKCSEMKKRIAGTERNAKFDEYLKKADANYEKNNVKFAFLYLIEALRMYPEGSAEVKGRLVMMASGLGESALAIGAWQSWISPRPGRSRWSAKIRLWPSPTTAKFTTIANCGEN